MNRIMTLFLALATMSCGNQNKNTEDSTQRPANADGGKNAVRYLTSTYDRPGENLEYQQSNLKALSDSNVFSAIHTKLVETLTKKDRDFFSAHSDYKLLGMASGDLYRNSNVDEAFIVYDNKNVRISIVLFDASKNQYSELYRDIKVVNGLETADCQYSSMVTLDYGIAAEIINQRPYLMKQPESFLEYPTCKIDKVSNENFLLDSGCSSKTYGPDENTKCLCIPTSFVYNNWECLRYEKAIDAFVIIYGQAFAD